MYVIYMYVCTYVLMYYVCIKYVCVYVCIYVCVCISYDFIAIFPLQVLTASSFVMGTQSLLAGRYGIAKLYFQELDSLKVCCLCTQTISFKMKTLCVFPTRNIHML